MPTGVLLALVIVAMPFLSGILIAAFQLLGIKAPGKGDVIGIGCMGVALACAITLAVGHSTYLGQAWDFSWITIGGIEWRLGVAIDGLTLALLLVVTIVSFLVHLFSKGYMHGDDRYTDFYRWLGLFTGSMLALVVSDNLLTLFVSWEVMGLASYKLIGHYYFKKSAYMACKKAFMTTRVGDIGFFLALLALYLHTGSLQFADVFHPDALAAIPGTTKFWIALGLFMGAAGKSAQFPLHIWLPNAMEGPTPVSALIHAATMVAAGVYLIGRMYTLIVLAPGALVIISIIGCFTALFAASIAFTRTDIKQVLAYSTISQLGFMFTALGVGSNLAWKAGMFHLVTHAFFKACLFLGSGSVIHGCHHLQDMTQMGGLRKKMPVTAITYLIACLAIAGFPFTAGYFSKDMILQSLWAGNGHFDVVYQIVFFVLALAALMTAAYMFRSYFLTFEGKPRDHHVYDHAHESPKSMTIGLMVLAGLAIASGYFWHDTFLPTWHTSWTDLGNTGPRPFDVSLPFDGSRPFVGFAAAFYPKGEHAGHAHHVAVIASLIVGLGGIALAAVWYLTGFGARLRQSMRAAVSPVYAAASRMYYIDEIVEGLLIWPSKLIAQLSAWFDSTVLDGFVDGTGSVTKKASDVSGVADDSVVDGAVQATAGAAWGGGGLLSRFQSGRVRNYLFGAVASAAVFGLVMLWAATR